MKFLKVVLSALSFVFAGSPFCQAHQIGQQEWCLAYTPYHRECLFKTSENCEDGSKPVMKYFKKNQASFTAILKENPSSQPSTFQDFDIHCEPNLATMSSQGI